MLSPSKVNLGSLSDSSRYSCYVLVGASLYLISSARLAPQPFHDTIEGMRWMDLLKPWYDNFDELYLYCYFVVGTVGLMSVLVMGTIN